MKNVQGLRFRKSRRGRRNQEEHMWEGSGREGIVIGWQRTGRRRRRRGPRARPRPRQGRTWRGHRRARSSAGTAVPCPPHPLLSLSAPAPPRSLTLHPLSPCHFPLISPSPLSLFPNNLRRSSDPPPSPLLPPSPPPGPPLLPRQLNLVHHDHDHVMM
jgi:hypothetical protein